MTGRRLAPGAARAAVILAFLAVVALVAGASEFAGLLVIHLGVSAATQHGRPPQPRRAPRTQPGLTPWKEHQ